MTSPRVSRVLAACALLMSCGAEKIDEATLDRLVEIAMRQEDFERGHASSS